MSLFQCDKCGCAENTSTAGGYHGRGLVMRDPVVLNSYREVLGLKEDEPYGYYCCVCNPEWFTLAGAYGIGPRPADPTSYRRGEDGGVWHGYFPRRFLPKGLFHTDEDGNLAHMETLETNYIKYELEQEDPNPPKYHHPTDFRLPRPNTEHAKKWVELMGQVADGIKKLGDGKTHIITFETGRRDYKAELARLVEKSEPSKKLIPNPLRQTAPIMTSKGPTPKQINEGKMAAAEAKRARKLARQLENQRKTEQGKSRV